MKNIFESKVWTDRKTEYPTRRKLVKTETPDVFDIERDKFEGAVIDAGDKLDAKNFNELENRIETSLNGIFDQIYPIGCIYQSVVSTKPDDLFGGTWVKLSGKFLACQSDGGLFPTAGYQGGSGSQKINIDHEHQLGANISTCKLEPGDGIVGTRGNNTGKINRETDKYYTINTIPPYEVVYMWRRTA